MTFEDAMEADDITVAEARREIERHGQEWDEFVGEVGKRDIYTGCDVLGWLGY